MPEILEQRCADCGAHLGVIEAVEGETRIEIRHSCLFSQESGTVTVVVTLNRSGKKKGPDHDYFKEWCSRPVLSNRGNVYTNQQVRILQAKGFTLEEYEIEMEKQGWGCAICRDTSPGSDLLLFCCDHNHASGDYRGFLCRPCNLMLGFAKDQPDRLRGGACFLERPPTGRKASRRSKKDGQERKPPVFPWGNLLQRVDC